jgi:hypothetical protein
MSADGFCCKNIWESAALVYAGFDVSRIEILSYRDVEFHFDDASSVEAQSISDDYQGGKLALSDAKAYALAFTKLNAIVRNLRKREESSWQKSEQSAPRSPEWWAAARESAQTRRQERETQEWRAERDKREAQRRK